MLTRAFATSPAKLIATKGRGATCWVYAATLGGGLVGGDEIRVRADVTTGARALLTTQASTKVYRSLRPSRQSLQASVEADALLAVVPDPVVCFAERGLHADAAIRAARRCEPRHGRLDHIGPPCRGRALGLFALREPVRHQARLAADFLRRARAGAEHRFCRRREWAASTCC